MTSDKFVKYTSIENHYQEGFLASCPQEDIWWCMTAARKRFPFRSGRLNRRCIVEKFVLKEKRLQMKALFCLPAAVCQPAAV